MADLCLYHRQACPYSKKVRDFIEANGIKECVDYHDVQADKEAFAKLQDLTGREQVPCLVINGQPLLESDDIIAWLQLNKDSLSGKPEPQQPMMH